MAETYCGKSCEDCAEREQLNCPGCRMGPGRALCGDCSISRCSVSKGYHACEYCAQLDSCRIRRGSVNEPSIRLRRQQEEAARKERLTRQIAMLGNWLWVLFWLVIASNISGFVLSESMTEPYPVLQLVGTILSGLFAVCYALILLKLAPVSGHYRYAGVAGIICAALNFAVAFIDNSGWTLTLSLIAMIPAFVTEYQEYMGHTDATEEIAPEMSQKWAKLWLWYFGSLCAMGIGLILVLFGSGLGALAVLAGSIITLVVAIKKIVYLYSTAKLFREYSKENL